MSLSLSLPLYTKPSLAAFSSRLFVLAFSWHKVSNHLLLIVLGELALIARKRGGERWVGRCGKERVKTQEQLFCVALSKLVAAFAWV